MSLHISRSLEIPDGEISLSFVRSSGPGGQNVNKVATAVQLHFNILESSVLTPEVKERLRALGGKRVSEQGELIIDARRYRTQARNRDDALERLSELIRRALHTPKRRRATKPTAGSKHRRLEQKKQHSAKKDLRRSPHRGD